MPVEDQVIGRGVKKHTRLLDTLTDEETRFESEIGGHREASNNQQRPVSMELLVFSTLVDESIDSIPIERRLLQSALPGSYSMRPPIFLFDNHLLAVKGCPSQH